MTNQDTQRPDAASSSSSTPSYLPGDEIDTVTSTAEPSFARPHPAMRAFDRFASLVTRWAGSPLTFCSAVIVVVLWAVLGPVFHYSDGWQLVINTGTTIITFLMVFLIQQSQNKDSVAMHLKLNELLASHKSADNQLIGIEDASEDQLRRLAQFYGDLAERAKIGQTIKPDTLPGHIAELLREDGDKQIITEDMPIAAARAGADTAHGDRPNDPDRSVVADPAATGGTSAAMDRSATTSKRSA